MTTLHNMTTEVVWNKLQSAGLVEGQLPNDVSDDTPWFIRAMQGFAGWIAALFLLGFFGTALSWVFDRDNASVVIILGLIGNGLAFYIFSTGKKNEFAHQLGLVFNLCGQLMVAWGIYEMLHAFNATFFFVLFIYQIILVVLLPDFVSRLLTTWFAMIALFACFGHSGIFNVIAMVVSVLFYFVWINDLKWHKFKSLWEPIGYALALSLLQFNGQLLVGEGINDWFHSSYLSEFNKYIFWLSKIVFGALFICIIANLAKQYQIRIKSPSGMLTLGISALLLLMTYYIVGINGALLLLIIGFMKQRRALIFLGIVAMLGFVSWYYYSLSLTLLTKSIILMGFGLCFFIAFYFLGVLTGEKRLSLSNLKEKYSMDKSKWIAVTSVFVILFAVNVGIYKKENILESGQIVLLELAPVDPRSLMQGDYMRLRFDIENTVLEKNASDEKHEGNNSGYFIVKLDENNVGTFSGLFADKDNVQSPTQVLPTHQVKMQFRVRNRRLQLATHAFFFQEGTASEYEQAKYGEFRVATNGELLLNNLRDKEFNILGLNRPSN